MYIYGCFLLCYLVNGKLTEWIGALMALLRARRISISIGYCTELGGHQRQGEILKLLQTSPLKFTQNFELNLDLADWAPAETCRTAPPIRAPLPIRWSLRIRTSCLCAMSVSSPENSSWTRALLLIRTPSACRQIQTPKWPSSGLDLRYPSAHLHICTRYPTAYYILLVLALSQDLNSLETHIRCYNKFLPGRVFYVISPRCAWPGHKTKDGMVVWKDQSDSLTAELVYE